MGCDGIWERYEKNSCGLMEIIKSDFKMKRDMKSIVSDTLDLLVSRDVLQTQGKGCDNMTMILVKLEDKI